MSAYLIRAGAGVWLADMTEDGPVWTAQLPNATLIYDFNDAVRLAKSFGDVPFGPLAVEPAL